MTNEEARRILIQDTESLKANPLVTVDDCLYEALDMAIKALRYKPITLKETDSEPRTLKAILDTETDEVYIRQATIEYWENVRGREVVSDDEDSN